MMGISTDSAQGLLPMRVGGAVTTSGNHRAETVPVWIMQIRASVARLLATDSPRRARIIAGPLVEQLANGRYEPSSMFEVIWARRHRLHL